MAYDPKALEKMVETLESLGSIPSQAAPEAAKKIESLIQAQFDAGTDPYGRRWAAKKDGSPSYLEKSGDLRKGVRVQPTSGAGIAVTVDMPYGEYHQTGTRYMPARKILPDEGDLPEEWHDAIEEALDETIDKKVK